MSRGGPSSPSATPSPSPSPSPRGIYGDIEIGNYVATDHHDDRDGDDERLDMYDHDDDDDTISDISFDEENYYNKDEIIMATRTASFKVTKTNLNSRTPLPAVLGSGPGAERGRASPAVLFSSQSSNPDLNSTILLGTLKGVFLPCIQTSMFGAMLFVKLPLLVAQLGILLSLTAIILTVSSTIFTLLSLIAIATNGKMKKSAGVYSLLKKYLGPELGGCIGIFHLVQKVGVTAMYCLAASETILTTVDYDEGFENKTTVYGIILCGTLSVFCLFPKYHQRFDEIALCLGLLTVLSFVVGTISYVSGGWAGGDMPIEHREFGDCILPHAETFRDPRRGSEALIAISFATMLSVLYTSMSGVFGASTRSGQTLSLSLFLSLCLSSSLSVSLSLLAYSLFSLLSLSQDTCSLSLHTLSQSEPSVQHVWW
jgi:hypothetical protein